MRVDRAFFLYDEGEGGGSPPPTGDISQAEHHVERAEVEVKQAAQDLPAGATHDLLKSMQETLAGVQAELKRANDRAEEAARPAEATTTAAVEEAEVEVTPPPVEARKVRRGHRKVARRG